MRSFWLIVLTFCIKLSKQDTISPTSSDGTNEYYTASVFAVTDGTDTYFQFHSINCGTSACHVDCDGDVACYQTIINASASDELNINCPNTRSCEQFEIISSPSTTLNIHCDGEQSCHSAHIMANNTANVYISCNNDTATGYSTSPCYYLRVKAPDATSLTMECIGPYTCYQSYIYANRAQSVEITINGTYAMYSSFIYVNKGNTLEMNINGANAFYGSYVYAYTMTAALSINCVGSSSCQSAVFYVTYMTDTVSLTCDGNQACYSATVEATDMTSTLKVDCLADYGCRGFNIKCPSTSVCDIDCMTANSCYDTHVTVPDNQYEDINLICNPSITTSCIYADITCSSTAKKTELEYDAGYGYFKCVNYDCCPIYEGTITCPVGDDCIVNCTSPNVCRKHYINATLSTSLFVDCEGSGCGGAKILCPTGDDTVCNISSGTGSKPLEYSVIETGTDNAMGSFTLDCATASSCDYAAVLLRSTSIDDVSISCGSTDSCRYTLFDITADITAFSLSCTSMSCRYMDLQIGSDSIDTFVLDCAGSSSCSSAKMTLLNSGAVINSYQLSCGGSTSCSYMTFNSSVAVINELTMDCTESSSCSGLGMNAEIRDQANMNCKAMDSCDSANINLVSLTHRATVDIQCVNPAVTTSTITGTCYNSVWTFTGDTTDNMTVTCHQYDCYNADFYGYDLMNVDIDCIAPNSCQQAYIYMSSADYLDLSCTNDYSCDSSSVYCPYREADSCKIKCGSSPYHSCYQMQIYVPDAFTFDYLSLSCPSEEINPSSDGCVGLDVNCLQGTKSQAQFTYNYDNHKYECTASGTSYCCPFFQGTKTVCTEGEDCSVDCRNTDCTDAFIDGTQAASLTVDCGTYYYCYNTLIHCPDSGCSIECSAQYSCYSADIVYNGELADSGTVFVNCTDQYACRETIISAQYASDVYLGCHHSSNSYPCYSTKLYVQYADTVNIEVGTYYSSYNSYIYADNANNVTLSAVDQTSFYQSYLYAADAGSLTIRCASDENENACASSYFYIAADTTLECYGHGCHETNYIYLGSHTAASLHTNVYSCGQCSSTQDCLYRLYLYCDWSSYSDYYYGSDYTTSYGWTNNYCGGGLANDNTVFSSSIIDENCANVLTALSCSDGEDCVINCNYDGHNCYEGIIDGSSAAYLTVNCDYSDYCQYAMIQCPVGGCTISCSYSNVCQYAQIIYSGTESTQALSLNGDVTVHCSEYYACYYMTIDADYALTMLLNCISADSAYNYPCYYLTLNANEVSYAEINFRDLYASYYTSLYVRNAQSVLVTAYGAYALYSSYIYAEFATSLEIQCGSSNWDYYTCYSSYYYIPYDTTFNCYGYSCYQLGNVYHTSSDYSGLQLNTNGCGQCYSVSECVNYFLLYCSYYSEGSYSYNEYCYGYTTSSYYCGCADMISRADYTNSDNYVGVCSSPEVSIGDVDSDEECAEWTYCTMYCNYEGKCSGSTIDGSTYAFLNVQCDGSYYCQNTVITCPNGGCTIDCQTEYACQSAVIRYEGTQEDMSSVTVYCAGPGSCYGVKIYAENAYRVDLYCKASDNLYDYVCSGVELRAEYASYVGIVGNNEYGLYNSKIHVNNTQEVTVSASGDYGFYSNYLLAPFAGSVIITCVSDEWASAACTSSYWYLPSNTTFNCYGPGCSGIGTIYTRSSAETISFNINACEGCDGVGGCLGSVTFYCGYPYSYYEYYYGYDYSYPQHCYDPSNVFNEYYDYYDNIFNTGGYCGCEEVIGAVSYTDNRNDQQCLNARSVAAQVGAIIGYCIAGICGLIILCFLYRKCCRNRKRNRYKNNQTFTVAPKPIPAQRTIVNPVRSASVTPKYQSSVPVVRYASKPVSNPVQTVVVRTYPALSSNTDYGKYTVGSNAAPGAMTTNGIQLARVEPVNASAPPISSAFDDAADAETPPGASAPAFAFAPAYSEASAPVYEAEAPPAYSDVMSNEGNVTNM